ncbi:MAG: alpha/beta hydrolase [Phaeodactylibacter sp.]|nr:alpha/beta hydrolase [Phaeodactylibacter sp.]
MEITSNIEQLASTWQDSYTDRPVKNPPILKLVQFAFGTAGRLFPGWGAEWAYRLFSTPRIRARHNSSDPILESARIFEFLYGKQLLKAYEWGSGDRVILLVHGWESRGTALRSFVPTLMKQGFKVVAFDGPAHGNSAGHRTNLPHFAGAIRAIINQVGGVHGIITHSFGGASTVFTLRYLAPELEVEKLVMIAPPKSIINVYREAVNTMKLPKSVAQRFKKILERKVGNRPLEELDQKTANRAMQVDSILLVHDESDPVVSFQGSLQLAENWENAHLLVTKGYGHYRLMKNPDLVQRIGEWIGPAH